MGLEGGLPLSRRLSWILDFELGAFRLQWLQPGVKLFYCKIVLLLHKEIITPFYSYDIASHQLARYLPSLQDNTYL